MSTTRRARPNTRPVITLLESTERDGAPLYSRVYRQLREHILRGALTPGARLPSARALASDLTLSRNTIESALLQLEVEGFIIRRVGAGSFVASTLPILPGPVRAQAPVGRPRPPRLSRRGQMIAELGNSEIEADSQTGICATDVHQFPLENWNRLLARRARRGGTSALLPVASAGVQPLRQAIAEYLRLTRGVHAEPEQVVVVSSTQQAIDLCARLLVEPGGVALMEEPGYPSARAALRAAGAVVRGISVDADGLVVDELSAHTEARLLYLTPSNQFPLGMPLSLTRRLALLRWAAGNNTYLLEDDYDSEFHYDGRPLAAMQGLDPSGNVIYAGTFNKVLFPSLRLAYLVMPSSLVDAFTAGRRLLDGYSPPLLQLTLADFITEGHFASHLRHARQRYAARRDILTAQATSQWGDHVSLSPTLTGLHMVAHLRPGRDDQRLARVAVPTPSSVGVAPLSHYYMSTAPRPGLVMSFGGATPAGIRKTVDSLTPLLTKASRQP
jgi:GntR family transcriptional regulator/MocR family aminotransferase